MNHDIILQLMNSKRPNVAKAFFEHGITKIENSWFPSLALFPCLPTNHIIELECGKNKVLMHFSGNNIYAVFKKISIIYNPD